jgi:hypothetical protein
MKSLCLYIMFIYFKDLCQESIFNKNLNSCSPLFFLQTAGVNMFHFFFKFVPLFLFLWARVFLCPASCLDLPPSLVLERRHCRPVALFWLLCPCAVRPQ